MLIHKVAILAGVLSLGTAALAQTTGTQTPDTSQTQTAPQTQDPNQPPAQTQEAPQTQSAPETTAPAPNNSPATTQDNTPAPTTSTQTQDSSQATVLVDPGKIYNQDPTHWVGKHVVLQNVMVEEADKAGNFWIGSDKHHRLLIVKNRNNPNLAAKEFHKGDVVTIDGTIHPAGDYEAAETNASNGKMKSARDTSGVFLLAEDVDIGSSTQHK